MNCLPETGLPGGSVFLLALIGAAALIVGFFLIRRNKRAALASAAVLALVIGAGVSLGSAPQASASSPDHCTAQPSEPAPQPSASATEPSSSSSDEPTATPEPTDPSSSDSPTASPTDPTEPTEPTDTPDPTDPTEPTETCEAPSPVTTTITTPVEGAAGLTTPYSSVSVNGTKVTIVLTSHLVDDQANQAAALTGLTFTGDTAEQAPSTTGDIVVSPAPEVPATATRVQRYAAGVDTNANNRHVLGLSVEYTFEAATDAEANSWKTWALDTSKPITFTAQLKTDKVDCDERPVNDVLQVVSTPRAVCVPDPLPVPKDVTAQSTPYYEATVLAQAGDPRDPANVVSIDADTKVWDGEADKLAEAFGFTIPTTDSTVWHQMQPGSGITIVSGSTEIANPVPVDQVATQGDPVVSLFAGTTGGRPWVIVRVAEKTVPFADEDEASNYASGYNAENTWRDGPEQARPTNTITVERTDSCGNPVRGTVTVSPAD